MRRMLQDRKSLYFILCIILISVLSLTVVYAALSVTLNITGAAQVLDASWNVHFSNIKVNPASVPISPKIVDSNKITFNADLEDPGDFYKFTVDIVNDGSIDAMIDSIITTPELTSDQKKYLKFEIEYTDGQSINTKQKLKSKETKTISILFSFRRDISVNDLPTTEANFDVGMTLVYYQADNTATNITTGSNKVNVVSGDGTQVGDEVCIKDECFYVMYSDNHTITMLAKYNLYIGEICTAASTCAVIENPTGIQNSTAIGKRLDESNKIIYPIVGITSFSDDITWTGINGKLHPTYNEQSSLYKYIDDYRAYIQGLYIDVIEARIISIEDYEKMGCTSPTCTTAPSWFYSTSYWTGVGYFMQVPYNIVVSSANKTEMARYNLKKRYGVRPVIVIDKSLL